MLLSNKRDTCKTWMNLKSITLNERSQTRRAVYCMISLVLHSGKGKVVGTENRAVDPKFQGGDGDFLQKERRERAFWSDENIL